MDGTGTGLTEQAKGFDALRLPGVGKKIKYHGAREHRAIRYGLKYCLKPARVVPIRSDLTTQTKRLTYWYSVP
jgi:hypothetical protein